MSQAKLPPDRFSPRKPGRQSRARETVDAILQASARILSRDGIAGLTTNRIAEIAGVSIGSLYQYFPGKDAVLHSVLEREFNKSVDGFVAYIESIDTAQVTLDEAVAGIVERVFDSHAKRRPLYRQILLGALSFRHLAFTLENDARVLAAVRRKFSDYEEVDREALPVTAFITTYALKGVQLGVVLANRPSVDENMRAVLVRLMLACLAPGRCRP